MVPDDFFRSREVEGNQKHQQCGPGRWVQLAQYLFNSMSMVALFKFLLCSLLEAGSGPPKMCERQLFAGTYIGKTKYNTEGFFFNWETPQNFESQIRRILAVVQQLVGSSSMPKLCHGEAAGLSSDFSGKERWFPVSKMIYLGSRLFHIYAI